MCITVSSNSRSSRRFNYSMLRTVRIHYECIFRRVRTIYVSIMQTLYIYNYRWVRSINTTRKSQANRFLFIGNDAVIWKYFRRRRNKKKKKYTRNVYSFLMFLHDTSKKLIDFSVSNKTKTGIFHRSIQNIVLLLIFTIPQNIDRSILFWWHSFEH